MPAGKRRDRLNRGEAAGLDADFTARLMAAARDGLDRLDALRRRRFDWAGQADALPERAPAARVRRFFGLPLGKPQRDPLELKAEELMDDLKAVARGRPLADPEIAHRRAGSAMASDAPLPGKDVAA